MTSAPRATGTAPKPWGPMPDPARTRSPLALLLEGLVRLYRLTAPARAPRCRFHPTCSTYALRAIQTHGAVRGAWLATRRLLRCHPWNPGGIDPVPEA